MRDGEGLFARVPDEFDRAYGNLSQEYIASHALVAMLSARLEWLTGALVNNAAATLGWPNSASRWPYKFGERLSWLTSALDSERATSGVREIGLAFLVAAERLNRARNDILHSAILGHSNDGRLYVARFKTDRKGEQLRLEEGVAWTAEIVQNVALDLIKTEKLGLDFDRSLAALGRAEQ